MLPALWHDFSCCRVNVWFAKLIAAGLVWAMDMTLRQPVMFVTQSQFVEDDPWMRPREPPDKCLAWAVCFVISLNVVNVVVLLGHEEALWGVLNPLCGAFVLQRALTTL